MITLPPKAQTIITALQNAGYEAYAVGGSVRDTLMGRATHGWDYTTNATPEQTLAVFPDSFYDNQFGTVGIKIYANQEPRTEDQERLYRNNETKTENQERLIARDQGPETGDQSSLDIPSSNNQLQTTNVKPIDIYEVTTYRSEKGYTDSRRPDVVIWGQSLLEDLSRRDFTINAIAMDGKNTVDPYEGQKDIEQKVIRTVGNPHERFSEDALRMMRAIRIAAEIGFSIEEHTFAAITQNAHLLKKISAERIRDELFRILASDYAADAVMILKATGILHLILPEVEAAFSVDQKSPKRHHKFDVGTHSVLALKNCPSIDPVVRLATLIHDIGKVPTFHKDHTGLITFFNHEVVGSRMAKQIAQRLRLSKLSTDRIFGLVRWHQFTVDERQTDSAIRRFIRRVGKENLEDMLALRIGDRLGGGALETSWRLELFKKRIEEVQLQPFSISDLKINGYDVMTTLGIQPGPIIGKALSALFAEVETETLANEKEALLKRLIELKATLLD